MPLETMNRFEELGTVAGGTKADYPAMAVLVIATCIPSIRNTP